MKLDFYTSIVNPKALEFKYILKLDIKETRGRNTFSYSVFWPCNSKALAKKEIKAWAEKQRIEILKVG